MPVRILIVDDHEIVRQGIRLLLHQMRPEWEITGEATTGQEAVDAVKAQDPDVVVLDITMPGLSGLEAASRMRKLGLRSRILMFTMHESERLCGEVRAAGAQGLVSKSQAARDLVIAIEALLGGGTFFGGRSEPEHERANPLTGLLFFARHAWILEVASARAIMKMA